MTGTLTTYDGFPEFNLTKTPQIQGTTTPPTPVVTLASQVGAADLGGFVALSGRVEDPTAKTFHLTDSTGTVSVYLPNGNVPPAGTAVALTGIVQMYKGVYQVEDVTLTTDGSAAMHRVPDRHRLASVVQR
jgi:hypothetical protein